jgi:hypothetical protein
VVADLADLADDADVVVNGVVGFAGLSVTVRTLRAGKRLALANKESLIAGAPVVQRAATAGASWCPSTAKRDCTNACVRAMNRVQVSRIVLTASGGPFRGRTAARLASRPRDRPAAPDVEDGSDAIDSSLDGKGLGVRPTSCSAPATGRSGRRASTVGGALDGRVHRRIDSAQLSMPDIRHRSATPWPTQTGSRPRSVSR